MEIKTQVFFHQSTLQRRARNKILRIHSPDGRWLEKEDEILKGSAKYYRSLFCAEAVSGVDEPLEVVTVILDDNMKRTLETLVTEKKTIKAAFSIRRFQGSWARWF